MRFYKWVERNRLLSGVLFSALLCAAVTALFLMLETKWQIVLIVDLFFVMLVSLFVQSCANHVLTRANDKMMNECNPLPLMEECEHQLKRVRRGANRQLLEISYAAALANHGDLQKAYDLLYALNIDRYAAMLPGPKVVYYHNFAYVCHMLGMYECADAYHHKAVMMYRDLLKYSVRQQRGIKDLLFAAEWEAEFRHDNYAKAMTVLDQMREETPLQAVDRAWGYANVYLAVNDSSGAEKHLRYVARYDQLLIGRKAAELLDQLKK